MANLYYAITTFSHIDNKQPSCISMIVGSNENYSKRKKEAGRTRKLYPDNLHSNTILGFSF